MPKGHKSFRLRGGVDEDDFPAREISLKDVRAVGRIAWEKWGHMVADHPPRDLIALAYAEGIYHGAMIGLRNPGLRSTIGTTPNSDSSAAASAAPSRMIETETLSVRDLLESPWEAAKPLKAYEEHTMTRDYLREMRASEALRQRETAENNRAIATASAENRNVTFIAHDGCEVTVTPNGHVMHNVADWY